MLTDAVIELDAGLKTYFRDKIAARLTSKAMEVVADPDEQDQIVPEAVAAPLPDLVGSKENDVLRLDAGHIGLAVGRTAAKVTIPRIMDFLKQRSEPAAASRTEA